MFSTPDFNRHVVITGIGILSPVGSTPQSFWQSLQAEQSGIAAMRETESSNFPSIVAGKVNDLETIIREFNGLSKDVKKALRKSVKVMNRETQLGVMAALQAITESALPEGHYAPERFGVSFGTGYVSMLPEDFQAGINACSTEDQTFHIEQWGSKGVPEIAPLWILKCLPNMPACHLAILGDLQGPNNSITQEESSANFALSEAYHIIAEGAADAMLVGGTGNTILPFSRMHRMLDQDVAHYDETSDPATICRPFDKHRTGTVLGEGAAAFLLEEQESANRRGATIYGEICGVGSSCVVGAGRIPNRQRAMENAMRATLRSARITPDDVGHLHAHGLSTQTSDTEEAQAIDNVFGKRTKTLPVVAAKSYLGNSGGGAGALETAASLLALKEGHLFPILNYTEQDPDCPISPVTSNDVPAGELFLNLNVVKQGQASCIAIRKVA
ncbi:3-oxoacyl-[acyl-carrier-protein] synthase, KASII [hydrothermal vent metagenome]|uniref:3-oxoacyl-[acyl-carrier-protein] synthase, KASII n=1 Tax=hydrothermal vent metagenome TaxID=652676 RepID=A0A3B1D488_9ZZZZ